MDDTKRGRTPASDRGRPREFDIEAALDAAQMVFCRDGYDAASLGTLTTAVGINPPSFYAAFGSKEKLFNQVLERYHAAFHKTMLVLFARPISTLEALSKFLDLVATAHTGQNPMKGCLIVNSGTMLCRDSVAIEQCLRALVLKSEKLIVTRIQQGKAIGDVSKKLHARDVAAYMNGLVHGMASIARTTQSQSAVRSIAKIGKQSLRVILS